MGTNLDEKIQSVFGDFSVDKGLAARLGLSGDDRHVPSYVMDWIVTHLRAKSLDTADLQGRIATFIQEHLPAKGDKEHVKFRLSRGESVTLLDAISVSVKLSTPVTYLAAIPCLDEQKALIDEEILARVPGLLHGATWGAAELRYDGSEGGGGIRIVDFKPMQTGKASLAAFEDCRRSFTVEEWLDVMVRTMGYEPGEYSEDEKLWLICRLIPLVQNRVNMMELAPPGSGKSFVFNNVSRHVWITTADITPAVLFYNRQSKTAGLLTRYDLLVLDEAQSIRFSNAAEIQAQLKGYLEQGVYARGDAKATAECGLMLLANIELRRESQRKHKSGAWAFSPERSDYIRVLPTLFQESPLVDRFHGIIPGWKIPVFRTEQQAVGFGLKADYFAEVLHSLRAAVKFSTRVRASLGLSGGKRDCTAVERLASGLSKLLLLEPSHPRFEELVVRPALEMRSLVRSQLAALDPQGYPAALSIRRGGEAEGIGEIRHYQLLEEIGKGGMAKVYRCLDTSTGSTVALKRVATTGRDVDARAIRREIQIYDKLRQMSHPNILQVYDVFRDGETYALVMEYAEGGTLGDLLASSEDPDKQKPLDPAGTEDVLVAVLSGLAAMHKMGIVHRDLKPQNILRCDDVWKIADFGISKRVNMPVTGFTFQGAHTAPWAPPEQITGSPAHPSADIYAIGRITSYLLTADERASPNSLPSDWAEFVSSCTAVDPDARPDVHAAMELLPKFQLQSE